MATTLSVALTATEDIATFAASLGSVLASDPVSSFRVIVDSEVMQVRRTSQAGRQAYLIRGIGGTTAAAHAAGATVTIATAPIFPKIAKHAGAVTDADLDFVPANDALVLGYDTTNNRLYVRVPGGTTWKYAGLT